MKSGMEDVIGGYEVDVASNGKQGLDHYRSFRPDIIVSDIEMPVMDGFEMVKRLRQTDSDIPIILATGKNNPKSVTVGYEIGANNYIKKPYTPEELDAHIRALIELKHKGRPASQNTACKIGEYTFDPKNLTLIYTDTEKIELTARESQILELLVEHTGEVVKREDILSRFWKTNDSIFASRSLDVFISKLRGYLSKDNAVAIRNVKQLGLILEVG
jgi:DNA-binding response OmpR family regulator